MTEIELAIFIQGRGSIGAGSFADSQIFHIKIERHKPSQSVRLRRSGRE
jgi:hypothetical protein